MNSIALSFCIGAATLVVAMSCSKSEKKDLETGSGGTLKTQV